MSSIYKSEVNFYTDTQAQIARSFAAQAAIAIQNAQSYAAVQEYAAESAALYRAAAQLLNPGTNLAGLAAQIARAVTHEFALANCTVLLINDTETELQIYASAGAMQAINWSAL